MLRPEAGLYRIEQEVVTTEELAMTACRSKGAVKLPRALAVLLTHSSLSSLAAAMKFCKQQSVSQHSV